MAITGVICGEKHIGSKRKQTLIATVLVILGVLAMLAYVYAPTLFGNWKYSYTNCLYRWRPFASLGVETAGHCYSDITDNVLPIAYSTIHQGIITAWVPTFSIGAPQGINLYFSLLNYLYLLPFDIAMPLIAVLKIIISFFGVFFFVRQLGYSARGGFIAGTTYALSAAMVTWQGWPHTEVGMYAPWLFLVLDKLVQTPRIRYCVITALLTFFMLMAGMPTFAAYFLYLAFVYALFYVCKMYWKQWRRIIVTSLVGVGSVAIGAIMSLPYLGGLLTSVGSNGYSEARSSWSSIGLSWPQLKTLVFPFLNTTTTRNDIESMLYTGVLALISLGLTVVNFRSKPRAGFFLVASCIILLLLFTSMFDLIFTHMPIISTSYKFRIVILLNFSLAILIGINFDNLFTCTFTSLKYRLSICIVSVIGLLVFVTLAIYTKNVPLLHDGEGIYQRIIAYITVTVFMIVVLVRAIFAGNGMLARVFTMICSVAICCVVVIDTGYFAMQYEPLIQKGASAIPEATETIRYLQKHTSNGEKIISKNVDLPVDSPMFYGLRDIRGHGFTMTNKDVKEYYSAIDSSVYRFSPTNTVFMNTNNENLLRYMGVKYIVSSHAQEDTAEYSSGQGMRSVGDDDLLIKELDNVAPNVQLVENVEVYNTNQEVLHAMGTRYKANTVFFSREYGMPENLETNISSPENVDTTNEITEVSSSSNGNMTINVNATADKYLLINEYDDGNWVAYIDGQKTPIYKGNGLFRAVSVPSGVHTIELKYEPTELFIFFIGTGMGAILLIVMIVFSKRENALLDKLLVIR